VSEAFRGKVRVFQTALCRSLALTNSLAEHSSAPQDGKFRACRRVQGRITRAVPGYQDARRTPKGCLISRPDPFNSQDDPQSCVSGSIYVYLLLPCSTNEDQQRNCLGHPVDNCMITENRKTCLHSLRLRPFVGALHTDRPVPLSACHRRALIVSGNPPGYALTSSVRSKDHRHKSL
jgi:hypothetical protein